MTEPHHDQADDAAATSDDREVSQPDEAVTASEDREAGQPDESSSVADPRVRDAVRRLNELSDLPPAEHVEVYEAVHSSLQESLAEASRQADESQDDGNSAS